MPVHDFATVRVYDMGDTLEIYFPKGDEATKGAVKAHRGHWDGSRYCWRIDSDRTNKPFPEVIEAIRQAILASAPDGWRSSVEQMAAICSVTRDFAVRFAEGGVRLDLPRGHKHHWTLKEGGLAIKDKDSWLIPSGMFTDATLQKVIKEVVKDDQVALSKALDYLEGFQLVGELDLAEGEVEQVGIATGRIIPVDPSFVRKADTSIAAEPLTIYPMKVLAFSKGEQFHPARLAFVTGEEAYYFSRKALDPRQEMPPSLDMRHVAGKWVRRRV